MAISVATTVVIPNLLAQLKITVTANEAVTILSWDQTTGAVTSAYLPSNLVALFQDRLARYVTPFVAPADLAAQVDALASVVELSELTGTVAQQSTLLGAVLSLEIIALTNNQPAYVYVGIPHSIISPIVPTLNGGGGGGSVIQAASSRLTVDLAVASPFPAYATFPLSAALTTRGGTNLVIDFACAAAHTGGFAGNVAINFRFLINGVLIPIGGGTFNNMVVSTIRPIVYSYRAAISAGLKTVTCEWSGFSLGANTMIISPVTSPNFYFAQLIIREEV